MQLREYAGPIRVLAAAVIGFSLLCSASALAMNDLNSQDHKGVRSLNIVDMVVENLSTSVALTQQAVSAFVATPTVVPTDTASFTATPLPSDTAVFLSPTLRNSTPTRRPRSDAAIVPSTKTPLPNTNTPRPPPTNTEPPPPPPTNTEPPPPPTEPPPPPTEPPPTPADTEVVPTSPPVIQNSDATPTVSP